MRLPKLRRLVATHCVGWCIVVVLLAALQPFLSTHFRQDGWEDEHGLRLRNAEATASFYPDPRADHGDRFETTLYVAAGASLDLPDALQHGLDKLLALVMLLLPLTVGLFRHQAPARVRHDAPPPARGGAPPPAAPWLGQPPKTAPPLPN